MAFYSIDIATTTAQTADITVALPGINVATFGDFTVTAHTGDFDCIITGLTGHSFGVWTLGTGDATHWSDIQRTAATDINVTSFVAVGCVNHQTVIKSVTNVTHTWSDTTGTTTVGYCDISYSIAEGGASWNADITCNNKGNNTGWIFAPLTMGATTQAQTIGAVVLVRNTSTTVDDSTQAQSTGAIDLTFLTNLAASDSSQAQTSGAIDLTFLSDLTVSNSSQIQTTDAISLVDLLAASDSTQAQVIDSISLDILRIITYSSSSRHSHQAHNTLRHTYQPHNTMRNSHGN
jgi:hypothetical protein